MIKPKVMIPEPIVPLGIQYLKDHGCEVITGSGKMDPACLKEFIKNADGLLVRTAPYTAEVLSGGRNIRVIARFGVGLDNIDLEYCRAHNIMVTIAPGANSNAVAEHTVMFILMLARNAVVQDENMRNGNYSARNTLPGHDVFGKTLAILGFGRIGRLVAQKAHDGLGMKIVAYNRHTPKEKVPDYVRLTDSFYEAVKLGDFVSVHIPALPENEGIINAEFLRMMKPGAYLINCSRGTLQNEDDLAYALTNHIIAGAALDVSRDEPNHICDRLWLIRENLICSPHNAALTVEAKDAMAVLAAQGIISVLNGEAPRYPAPGFGSC
ncbi:MAG: hydroxyacid dehydrogenase [Pyramidobacter sp.]